MIKLKRLLKEVEDSEIEDLQGKDAILQYLVAHGKEPQVIDLGGTEYIIWDDSIVDAEWPYVKEKNDWIYGTEGQRLISRLIGAFDDKFNERFWEHPERLFHATPTENVENIKANGLSSQHKSRGFANKHIRAAVFTSTEPDWITHSYGPSVITIHTDLMKKDGFTPYVTKEPNHIEADVTNFVARKIGAWKDEMDLSNSRSEGTTDDTVIIHSPVPAKYLSFELV